MQTTSLQPDAPKKASGINLPVQFFWQGKIAPAFWTIASALSMTANLILIIILLFLGRELFALKSLVSELINGLHSNFVAMEKAHIRTMITVEDTIEVNDTMPVVFTLPLQQNTEVILTQDTPVHNATVFLNGSPVVTDIILRQGTRLNIALNLEVPVNQTIPITLKVPVNLQVPVDIPLDQTELYQPFVGLQQVVLPYKTLLDDLPNSWYETPICGPLTDWFCSILLGAQ